MRLTLFSASRYESNLASMFSTIGRHESSLLTKSPKPGVSTTVNRRRTPFSSISALIDCIETVLGMMSMLGPLRSFGGYRDVLKRVLTNVDFPRPDSPKLVSVSAQGHEISILTNNHDVEVEAFSNTFAVPLIGQICKSHIAGELPTDDVFHITGLLSCRSWIP